MRKLSATLIGIIAAITAHAGTQNVAIVTEDLDDVLVEHVAYSPLTINATYDIDVSAGGTLVIVDTDGTIIVSTVATAITANTLQAIMPAGYWAFDLKKITRYYGDMRVTGYGNPLPWLAIDVRPAYNTGSEASLQPIIANYYTNAIVVPQTVQLDFGAGFESVYTATNQRLSVAVSSTNLAAHTNLTLALGAHGGELDPVWAAVSNVVTTGAALGATAIQTELDPIASSNLTVHIDDPTAAHAASAVSQTNTPLGSTVQDAVNSLNAFLADYIPLAGTDLATGQIKWDDDNFFGPDDINVVQGTATDYSEIRFTGAGTGGWRTFADSDWVAGIKISSASGTEIGGANGSITIATNGTITADQPISGVDAVAATDLATFQQILWTGTTNDVTAAGDATVTSNLTVLGDASIGGKVTALRVAASQQFEGASYRAAETAGLLSIYGGRSDFSASGIAFKGSISGEHARFDYLGNFGIGTNAPATKLHVDGAIALNNTTTPTANTDYAQFFATNAVSAEMWVMDGDGNATQLSSHDDNQKHIANSYNVYTGEGKSVDLWALADAVQQLTGRSDIVTDYAMPARDWDEEQAARVGKRDAAIGRWMSNTNSIEAKGAKPAKLEAKGKPQWLIDWTARQ